MNILSIILAVLLGISLLVNGCLLAMWVLTAEALKRDEKIIKASQEVLNEKMLGGE